MKDSYESPLASRYASKYMLKLFSADARYQTWRKLWTALAELEAEEGLNISEEQIEALRNNIGNIDYDVVSKREKEVRHDVMAHIYAYGKAAPKAAGIIHLGATSCYVTDNADLILYRDGLKYLRNEVLKVLNNLRDFSESYKDLPILSYTHYQPAQPSTLGKRGVLWMQDFIFDVQEIDHLLDGMKFLGCRGTTGTEASFMDLFNKDEEKIDRMNQKLAKQFGFKECFPVASQTYPRKLDSFIFNVLSSIGQSAYKFAEDLRLFQHDGYLEEPFEQQQVGSSAMAYKRNPIRCERICSLSRYLMTLSLNGPLTASVQWLDRSLDDSANRRISLPEAFLCADAILALCQNVAGSIKVNRFLIEKNLKEYLPFVATENIMMEAVKKGKDRQEVHEIIRSSSMEAIEKIRKGQENDLMERLIEKGLLNKEKTEELMKPELYTGRSAKQVEMFLKRYESLIDEVQGDQRKIEL